MLHEILACYHTNCNLASKEKLPFSLLLFIELDVFVFLDICLEGGLFGLVTNISVASDRPVLPASFLSQQRSKELWELEFYANLISISTSGLQPVQLCWSSPHLLSKYWLWLFSLKRAIHFLKVNRYTNLTGKPGLEIWFFHVCINSGCGLKPAALHQQFSLCLCVGVCVRGHVFLSSWDQSVQCPSLSHRGQLL